MKGIFADKVKTNPKLYHINMKTKTTLGIVDLESLQKIIISNDIQKAEILAYFVNSVFTQETLDNIPAVQNKILEEKVQEHKIKRGATKGVD